MQKDGGDEPPDLSPGHLRPSAEEGKEAQLALAIDIAGDCEALDGEVEGTAQGLHFVGPSGQAGGSRVSQLGLPGGDHRQGNQGDRDQRGGPPDPLRRLDSTLHPFAFPLLLRLCGAQGAGRAGRRRVAGILGRPAVFFKNPAGFLDPVFFGNPQAVALGHLFGLDLNTQRQQVVAEPGQVA